MQFACCAGESFGGSCTTADGCSGQQFCPRTSGCGFVTNTVCKIPPYSGSGPSKRTCTQPGWSPTSNATQQCYCGGAPCGVATGYAACSGQEVCDGYDNNLNGAADETPGLTDTGGDCNPMIVGNSSCSSSGIWTCNNGNRFCDQCSATYGTSCGRFSGAVPSDMACYPECNAGNGLHLCSCKPTPNTMTFGSSGPQTWPGACWRPFEGTLAGGVTESSPFNKLIPASAKINQLHANSSNIVKQLVWPVSDGGYGPPHPFAAQYDGHLGEPTYYSRSTDPVYTVSCENDEFGAPDASCPIQGQELRIPAYARPEGYWAAKKWPDGTPIELSDGGFWRDAHITVIDVAGGYEWDFWQVNTAPLPSTGGTIEMSYGNKIALNSTGLHTDQFGNTARAGTAANFANLAGRIRVEELEAGEINHALFLNLYCTDGTISYPAGQHARVCGTGGTPVSRKPNAPATGAHFFYDRTPAQIDAMNIPKWKKTVLKALSRYGAFVGDTGSNWAFEIEAGATYTLAGASNKWWNFGVDAGWSYTFEGSGQADDQMYSRLYAFDSDGTPDADGEIMNLEQYLKVLKPCVSQGTCN